MGKTISCKSVAHEAEALLVSSALHLGVTGAAAPSALFCRHRLSPPSPHRPTDHLHCSVVRLSTKELVECPSKHVEFWIDFVEQRQA